MKKHNRLWFKNRIGKKVWCDDHNGMAWNCRGIDVESDLVAENLYQSQKREVVFYEKPVTF